MFCSFWGTFVTAPQYPGTPSSVVVTIIVVMVVVALLAIGGSIDREAGFLKRLSNRLRERGVIFDQQNAHRRLPQPADR